MSELELKPCARTFEILGNYLPSCVGVHDGAWDLTGLKTTAQHPGWSIDLS